MVTPIFLLPYMNKLQLRSFFTKNVVQELERLTNQSSDTHSMLGLAYVDISCNGERRKGWKFNVFGNKANEDWGQVFPCNI